MSTENDKRKTKPESDAARRKKEEQARRSRRRSRQWIGLVLAVLVVVGVVTIVRSAIGLVQGIADNTEEKTEFENRIRYFVWFDVLPFESLEQADQDFLKQVAIWGIVDPNGTKGAGLERNADGQLLVPVLEVDHYAAALFGPQFRFASHGAFTDMNQGLQYGFDEANQVYMVPITSLEPMNDAVVVDIQNEQNGVKRVTVGYVALRSIDGTVITTPDREHPVRYMDFLFQRDGNEYYLTGLVRNTTLIVNTPQSQAAQQPVVSDDIPDASSDVSLPESAADGGTSGDDGGTDAGDGTSIAEGGNDAA
jgi:hypothetical protein